MKDPVLPDATLKAFQDRQQWSRRYKVYQSGNDIYQVQVPHTGVKYVVNLLQRTCDCTNFQWYKSPCAHAIAACRWAERDPYKMFWKYYKVRVYRDTYSEFLEPFSIQDLPSSEHIYPPVLRRQRGRPKSKRFRKGEHQRNPKKCSTCSQKGHDKRSCRNQPVAHGRRQRVRDRALSSSPESSPGSTNRRNQGTWQNQRTIPDLEAEDSILEEDVELQFQTEIEYDERRALTDTVRAAWEAQKEAELLIEAQAALGDALEDSDSDRDSSSLSTVSSSQFEGLEEDWWKDRKDGEVVQGGDSEVGDSEVGDSDVDTNDVMQGILQGSASQVISARTRSRSRKRVHFE
jgi:hypothetical protein